MSLLVLTGYDDAMREIGDLTTPGKLAYALRHGYEFRCVRRYEPGTHPSWQKLALIHEAMQPGPYRPDAILWLDADTVVTNPDFDALQFLHERTPLGARFVVSLDWSYGSPWCAGNMLIRTHHPLPLVLGNILLMDADRWGNTPLWDQSALQARLAPEYLHLLPRRVLNAVPRLCRDAAPEPWEPGDFLCHCTCDDPGRRLEAVRAALRAGCQMLDS
jgi:hypothetical protein